MAARELCRIWKPLDLGVNINVKYSRKLPILATGAWGRVVAGVAADGSYPGKDFIDGLDDKERAKLVRWVEYLAETGVITNREKFKQVEGWDSALFEFKSYQVRLLGFFLGEGRFVVTNGFWKKDTKADKKAKQHYKRADAVLGATRHVLKRR